MSPRSSRVLVRTALGYLVVGGALGLAMLAGRTAALPTLPAVALELHAEILLVGWIVQLATGVALWIFPRAPGEHARRPDRPGWVVLSLLNGGIACVALEALVGAEGALRLVGRGAELAAIAVFLAQARQRLQGGLAAHRAAARGAG